MKKRTAALFGFSLFFALAMFGVYAIRQQIKDYYIVRTTDLSTTAATIGSELDLTPRGDFVYQASQTELQKAPDFRASCNGFEKQAIILGCYSTQRIYIYNITDKKLQGVREVTAAHELLHALYERLSSSDRSYVNNLLEKQASTLTDKNVKATLKLYSGISHADLLNEMHSIFGTELKNLSPELEDYYQQYFEKRSEIVAYANEYQAVFDKLEKNADQLKQQLAEKNQLKDASESELNSLVSQIKAKQQELNKLRSSDPTAYNVQVPAYNNLVNRYNELVAEYKTLIADMNNIISEINSNITQLNNLTQKLDSSYSTY